VTAVINAGAKSISPKPEKRIRRWKLVWDATLGKEGKGGKRGKFWGRGTVCSRDQWLKLDLPGLCDDLVIGNLGRYAVRDQ
jgi:hypothetical protein